MVFRKNLKKILLSLILALYASSASGTGIDWQKRGIQTAKIAAGLALGSTLGYVAAQLACGNSIQDMVLFALQGLKHPVEVGTIWPCSRYLGQALIAKFPKPQEKRAFKYLEAGAGTGIVSAQILKHMGPDDMLDLVEYLEPLCDILRDKFKEDIKKGRVRVIHCSITDFNPDDLYEGYDAIATTLPFNAFDVGFVRQIWAQFLKLLAPGGSISCVNYRFFPTVRHYLEPKKRATNLNDVGRFLDYLHANYGDGFSNVWRNVPPIRVRYFEFPKPLEALEVVSCLA